MENQQSQPRRSIVFRFTAQGAPRPQPRGRATRRGAHAHVYDPGTADDWKGIVRQASRSAKPPTALLGPLDVILDFRFARPKGHYRKSGGLTPKAPREHLSNKDVDNLAKAVMDCLTNEGWWRDDGQVIRLVAAKSWGDEASQGVSVVVTEWAET